MHVTQQGFVHAYPDTGCVLRCEPDGSHLEVVAVGLRNANKLDEALRVMRQVSALETQLATLRSQGAMLG